MATVELLQKKKKKKKKKTSEIVYNEWTIHSFLLQVL